jgi:hypothetical protein
VELVASWYNRFLNRFPDARGLAGWVSLLRGGAPEWQVQAAILASPEFVAARSGTPDGFVRGLYQAVLGRTPNFQEVRGWLIRLDMNGGDRLATAGEFLQAAQTELALQNWYYPH